MTKISTPNGGNIIDQASTDRSALRSLESTKTVNTDGYKGVIVNTIQGTPLKLASSGGQTLPRIPPPFMEPDVALLFSENEVEKMQNQRLKDVLQSLQQSADKLDELHTKKNAGFKSRIDKAFEEQRKKQERKTADDVSFGLSIAGTILGLIGSGILFFLSGGAAAPLLVGAVLGAVNTVMDGVDRGLREHNVKWGGQGVLKDKQATATLAGLLGSMYEAMMEASPEFKKLPQDEQDRRMMAMKTAVAVGVSLMMVGASIASVAGTFKAGTEIAKAGANLSSTITRVSLDFVSKGAELMQSINDLASVGSTIAGGVFGVQQANVTFELKVLDNQRQFFEDLAGAQQKLMDDIQQSIQTINEELDSIVQGTSGALKEFYDVQKEVTANV